MGRRGRPPYPDILTPREWEVLDLLRQGLSNPEIAERLGISRDGVKYHVSEILGKLGVGTREQAANWRPEEYRPWWAAALAPVVLGWRKAGLAVAGAVAVAAIGGLAFLAFLLLTSADGDEPLRGSQLAYLDADGALWLEDADGNSELLTEDGACGRFPYLDWSPEGSRLACLGLRQEGQLVLLDREGALVAKLSLPGFHSFAWSPDGRAFLYGIDDRLVVADDRGETIVELGPWDGQLAGTGWASYGYSLWSPDGERLVYRAADAGETRIFSLNSTSEEVFSRDDHPLAWAMNGEALIAAQNYQSAEGLAYPAYETWLLHLSEPALNRRLPALDNGRQFWLSPDGTRAAVVTREGGEFPKLNVLDLTDGRFRPLEGSIIRRPSSSISPGSVSFSGDGRYLYWKDSDDGARIYRAYLADGTIHQLVQLPTASVEWSPDFTMVAYQVFDLAGDQATLYVARMDGSHQRALTSRGATGTPLAFAWRPIGGGPAPAP